MNTIVRCKKILNNETLNEGVENYNALTHKHVISEFFIIAFKRP